jgi:hypothetical protein
MVLFLAGAARTQDTVVMPLIPASDWRELRKDLRNLGPVEGFNLDPAVEREYGVQKLEVRQYQLGQRRADVLVELASDPTAAYGLMTYYRHEALTPEKGLELAFIGPSSAVMARGRTFVRAQAQSGSEVGRQEFAGLLIAIGGTRPSRREMENFPAPLPPAGLLPHSEKYLLGLETARRVLPGFRTDLIGFSQGAEARVANYSTSSGAATLLQIHYPTPQIARTRFGAMESLMSVNHDRAEASIWGKRSGSYVFLALTAKRNTADELLRQFEVTSAISWNEPAPEPERFVIDLVRMILAILLLVSLIVAFAVIAGVGVVLSRRLARRFFPDWEWADPDREKLIRLNLH